MSEVLSELGLRVPRSQRIVASDVLRGDHDWARETASTLSETLNLVRRLDDDPTVAAIKDNLIRLSTSLLANFDGEVR